jgi:NAD(P)-dependent dehydrogenase (short-subunit alcohol dehydrogenase family)
MSGRLQDRVAIVTGAGCIGPGWGNGRATAVRFAEEGAKIFAADRDLASVGETLERTKAAGGEIVAHQCDVTDAASVEVMVKACLDRFGRIDILVNNVGGSAHGGPVELSEAAWDAQVDTNLKSVFLTLKYVLPMMERQKAGAIVNIASICAGPAPLKSVTPRRRPASSSCRAWWRYNMPIGAFALTASCPVNCTRQWSRPGLPNSALAATLKPSSNLGSNAFPSDLWVTAATPPMRRCFSRRTKHDSLRAPRSSWMAE